MHAELARRRAYLHLCRWTSLGLSLIEAMAIGMPVVALATTEAVVAVPPDAGALVHPGRHPAGRPPGRFVDEPAAARRRGRAGPRGRPRPATASTGSSPTGTGCWRRKLCASR